MQSIIGKVSYLQGLSEGLTINEGSPQGKIISGMLAVLNEMADEIGALQRELEQMHSYIECVDDDLMDLEEIIAGEEYLEVECGHCGEQLYVETDSFEDEDIIEIICPNCNETVFINDGAFDYQHLPVDEELEMKGSNPTP
ncbi:MAG: CD1247 N-terminal domain-containing protein [Syntrophomonadaceae bacterium]